MASYNSDNVNQKGQSADDVTFMRPGLLAQDVGSGAPGSTGPGGGMDTGDTLMEGQYPSSMPFVGTALGGTGAPGTQGVSNGRPTLTGTDSVTFTPFTAGYKSIHTPDAATEQGDITAPAQGTIGGTADWTQANDAQYGPGWNAPGVEGNTPMAGTGEFQPGSGRVRNSAGAGY
jgi:hypothetical protein